MSSRRLIAFALFAGVILSQTAQAGPADRKKVAAHKRAAFERLQAGDYPGGIEQMRAAHALVPHPGFLLNIAVAYHQWGGHCVEALQGFEDFREACPDCRLREAGEKRRQEVVSACEVPVTVRTEPPGASLTLDGEPIGLAPTEVAVLPGAHRVMARLKGHAPAEQGFQIAADGLGPSLVLELVPLDRPRTTPAPQLGVSAPVEPTSSGGPGAWPWVSLGVGALGLGAGALFTVQTLDFVDQEEATRVGGAGRAEIEALRNDAESSAILAHVGYGVGVVGVGVAVLLWALGDDAPQGVTMMGSAQGATAGVRF